MPIPGWPSYSLASETSQPFCREDHIAAQACISLILVYKSAGAQLSAGAYQAELLIQSNDPNQPFQRLPLDLTVV